MRYQERKDYHVTDTYLKILIICHAKINMFLQCDAKKKKPILRVSALHQHRVKRENTMGVPQCVAQRIRVGLKDFKNDFSAGTVNSGPGRCPLTKLCFLPVALWCPASQRRCSETQHIKWDVTCATILFYLYWMGRHWERDAKKRSPAAWWEVWWLSKPTRSLCNFHPHIWECMGDFTSPFHSHSHSPKYPFPCFCQPPSPSPQRQRKTADNYLVWNFLAAGVFTTQCVGVTQLIFDDGFEDMQHGKCVDACVGGAPPWGKDPPLKIYILYALLLGAKDNR